MQCEKFLVVTVSHSYLLYYAIYCATVMIVVDILCYLLCSCDGCCWCVKCLYFMKFSSFRFEIVGWVFSTTVTVILFENKIIKVLKFHATNTDHCTGSHINSNRTFNIWNVRHLLHKMFSKCVLNCSVFHLRNFSLTLQRGLIEAWVMMSQYCFI